MLDLNKFRRTTAPGLEAAPQQPVAAVELLSPKGIDFTLVREAVWSPPDGGRACSWFVWRNAGCVGFVSTNVISDGTEPFIGPALRARRSLNHYHAFKIWKSCVTDGHDPKFHATPSRGLGIMTVAYTEIVRQVSLNGWALASNPTARSRQAKALWLRLGAVNGVEVVRSREHGEAYDFAFMLAPALTGRVPASTGVTQTPTAASTSLPQRAILGPAEPVASD